MYKVLKWFFPVLSVVIFGTLLWAMLLSWSPGSAQGFLSFASGLLAYSMMLTVVLISVRPKKIEHQLALPEIYTIHGWMSMTLFAAIVVHVFIQWNGLGNIFSGEMSTVSLWGFIGVLFLVIVMLTGIFVLSNTFIKRSRKLMQLKETYFKRERHLWLHRLAILSVAAIYLHMFNLGFLASNTVFMALLTGYTVIVLGWYFIYKIRLARLPRYKVHSITKPTPTLYEIDLMPADGSMMDYKAGQYAFLRFVGSDVSSESHPFSFTSAPTHNQTHVQVMIKEAGDFTNTLDKVKLGDELTLEGPYGNYFPREAALSDTPMVLLSGGIGMTPNLSILRHEIAEKTDRKIHFVWGLALGDDLMLIDEFEEIEKEHPNFSYHMIFSNEEVAGYSYGFITYEYLNEIGVGELYDTANFYICGPAPMINAAKKILKENNVPDENVYLEEFAF